MKLQKQFFVLIIAAAAILVGCGGGGGGGTASSSSFRAVNATFGGNALDVQVGGSIFARNLTSGTQTLYGQIAAGDQNVQFVDASSRAIVATLRSSRELHSNARYTAIAYKDAADTPSAVLVEDDNTVSAGEGRLRFVNVIPAEGSLDVYVQPGIVDLNTVEPTFTNVSPATASAYTNLTPGTYVVTFVTAGTKVSVGDADLTVAADSVTTLMLTKSLLGSPYWLLLHDEN
jgi:hypothetical protein